MTSNIQALKVACIAAVCLVSLSPNTAHAEGTAAAPALYNVEEVIVQAPHFGDGKTASTCGISADELSSALVKTLVDKGVPAMSIADAKPPVQGRARINLLADIYSLNSEGLDCTSWVSLTAETRNNVHVPPVDLARNITVLYWQEGSMLGSGQTTHDKLVTEALLKMAKHFADQYQQDQPASFNK